MNKRTIKNWQAVIDKNMAAVAKVRDKIDDDISEMEMLRENCREAWDDLQRARDALSELV